jgi:hypothetical protein
MATGTSALVMGANNVTASSPLETGQHDPNRWQPNAEGIHDPGSKKPSALHLVEHDRRHLPRAFNGAARVCTIQA